MMIQTDTEHIWHDFGQALRTFIKRRVANDDDADDILQDVFLKIQRKIGGLNDTERLRSWIYQISRNAIVDYYRSKKILVEVPETLPTATSPEPTLNQDLAACLRPFVDQLPPKYREALILTEFEGLTQKEMGERLGLSLSGAKSRVQRGRRELKALVLACCHVEFDRAGNILDYYSRESQCDEGCDDNWPK